MAPRRKPGRDPGRPAIDWEQAFTFYASLSPERRSYQMVAAQFGVSVRTVERHGREEGWRQRLREIKARVAAETNSSLGQARAEQIGKLAGLIDATLIGYADKLRRGELRMTPADLDRLHKLWGQLSEELAQPDEARDEQSPSLSPRSPEHVAAVVEALADSGALEQFRLRLADTAADNPEEEAV
jgi:hypothetical protein